MSNARNGVQANDAQLHYAAFTPGGTLVPAELVRRIESTLGVRFSIVFGTTECSPLLTQTKLDDAPADKADTFGQALPQTEIKIADLTTGASAPVGTRGELCTRSNLVMSGYYHMPDATAAAIDNEGWYHTGDLASMDQRGYCRVEGRVKDMIIRGGENIYPREIEDPLFSHPGIAACRQHLAPFKTPPYWVFADALPLTSSGKI